MRHRPIVENSQGSIFVEEFDRWGGGKQTGPGAADNQLYYSLFASFTVAERPLVHIHADKRVGQLGVHLAGELHGVIQGLFAVLEAVGDAVADGFGNVSAEFRSEG